MAISIFRSELTSIISIVFYIIIADQVGLHANVTTETGYWTYVELTTKFGNISARFPLNFNECKNLFEGDYERFELETQLLNFVNASCVELFQEQNCVHANILKLRMPLSVTGLAFSYRFGEKKVRSLRTCQKSKSMSPDSNEDHDSGVYKLLYSVLLPVAFISLLALIGLTLALIRNKRDFNKLHKTVREKLPEKEIHEFLQGLGLQLDEIKEGKYPAQEEDKNSSIENEHESSKLSFDLLAQNQPYNCQLEVPLSHLKFDTKYPIGSGEFGNVFKGTLARTNEEELTVAIKTPKPYSNAQYLRALLKEIKVMMYVGQHSKIVALLGCSTAQLRKGELFIILEYCANGSLERYMKSNRANFVNIVHKGQIVAQKYTSNITPVSSLPENYVQTIPELYCTEMQDSGRSSLNGSVLWESSTKSIAFDIHQLITWTIEVAEGMEYLAHKKVIHGDLSARNVLLTADMTAKVSDFGLSRKMYQYSHCTKNGEDPLPWRWLALESLKNLQFSTSSDVWSYGILLWEIFTLGEQPYPGISSLTNNFIGNLEQGLRPTIPSFATSDIYSIMACCWDENSKHRPSFERLIASFQEVLEVCRNKSGMFVTSL